MKNIKNYNQFINENKLFEDVILGKNDAKNQNGVVFDTNNWDMTYEEEGGKKIISARGCLRNSSGKWVTGLNFSYYNDVSGETSKWLGKKLGNSKLNDTSGFNIFQVRNDINGNLYGLSLYSRDNKNITNLSEIGNQKFILIDESGNKNNQPLNLSTTQIEFDVINKTIKEKFGIEVNLKDIIDSLGIKIQ